MGDKITIYRVCNDDNEGCYTNLAACCEQSDMVDRHSYNDMANHPSAYEDGFADILEDDQYFGFKDLNQLTDWFDEDELYMLYDNGFKIWVVECDIDDVVFLGKQVIFRHGNYSESLETCGVI